MIAITIACHFFAWFHTFDMEPPLIQSQLVAFYLWGGAFCYRPGHVPLSHRSRKRRVPFRPLGRRVSPGSRTFPGERVKPGMPVASGWSGLRSSIAATRTTWLCSWCTCCSSYELSGQTHCVPWRKNSGKRVDRTFPRLWKSEPLIFQKFCLGCGRPDVVIWL